MFRLATKQLLNQLKFPLIRLQEKSKVKIDATSVIPQRFPLIRLQEKSKENCPKDSRDEYSLRFPLIRLQEKSKVEELDADPDATTGFH